MMHFIDLETNTYKLLDEEGTVLLSIKLTDEPGDQIILETQTEIFAGPVKFLNLSSVN